MTHLADTPMKAQFPIDKHQRVINAHLNSGLIDISASDWMASPSFNPVLGNMSAPFVTSEHYDELKAAFDRLADGAEKERFQALHEMPFGQYGQFYDRYGMQWFFVQPRP